MPPIQQQIESTVAQIPRGLAAHGVVAIVFGVLVLVWLGRSVKALGLLVGAFAVTAWPPATRASRDICAGNASITQGRP
jgi:hypothetical protein